MDLDQLQGELKAPIEAFPRPESTLGPRARIKDCEDAETAFAEVSWCEAVESAVQSKANDLLAAINELTREVLLVISERRELLEGSLLEWADDNRSSLCNGKTKTVPLRGGTIQWRFARDAVEYLEGHNQKTAIDAVVAETGVIAKLREIVAELEWFDIFEPKLTLNKANALKAVRNQQVSPDRLATIGLQMQPGEENVIIKAADFVRCGV